MPYPSKPNVPKTKITNLNQSVDFETSEDLNKCVLKSVVPGGTDLVVSKVHMLPAVHDIMSNIVNLQVLPSAFKKFTVVLPTLEKKTAFKILSKFKKAVEEALKQNPKVQLIRSPEWYQDEGHRSVTEKIVKLAYQMGIPRPEGLNSSYKPFTSEVYGELELSTMAAVLDSLDINENTVFLDLGSGVGQLVTFTAAYKKIKKAVGIELNAVPADMATHQKNCFLDLMKYFKRDYSPIDLIKGSFLDVEHWELICGEANLIFVNNLVFDDKLTQQLEEILANNRNKAVIIHTKMFSKPRGSSRRGESNSFAAVSTTETMDIRATVSWTSNKIELYKTTIDHQKFQNTLAKQKADGEERKNKLKEQKEKREQNKKGKREAERRGMVEEDEQSKENSAPAAKKSRMSKK